MNQRMTRAANKTKVVNLIVAAIPIIVMHVKFAFRSFAKKTFLPMNTFDFRAKTFYGCIGINAAFPHRVADAAISVHCFIVPPNNLYGAAGNS
jgi:hypothetical protein